MEFDRIILFTPFPTAQLFLADCLATATQRGSVCLSSSPLRSESSREGSDRNKPQAGVHAAS